MATLGAPQIFTGCNFFRQRVVMSVLSGRNIAIKEIRASDEEPGIKDFEAKLLQLLENLTNGSRFHINRTGTEVRFEPGSLMGGKLTFDCGKERCISYFLEPLLQIAPFCKHPLDLKLLGITNKHDEISVDGIRSSWLPIFNRFVVSYDAEPTIKINARGFFPNGGGIVTVQTPIIKKLRPSSFKKQGLVRKIRGMAYVCKGSATIANRMIESAKTMLRDYVADVYITSDHRQGSAGGASPGFGLLLTAETTEGVIFHAEAMSKPRSDNSDSPSVPEDIGAHAASKLLSEMFRGGCMDSSAQLLTALFMTLCENDVSAVLCGPLSDYSVGGLRHLSTFFNMVFKLDRDEQDGDDECTTKGSPNRIIMTGMGLYSPTMSSVTFTGAENHLESSPASPEVHVLPCRLHYSGPANVSSYFLREKKSGEEGAEFATFRGHWMHGVQFEPKKDDNLSIFIAKETSTKNASKRVFTVEHKLDSIRIWDEETVNPSTHPIFRASNHIKLAEALSVESDNEEQEEAPPACEKICFFLQILALVNFANAEPFSLLVGAGTTAIIAGIYGSYSYTKCLMYECCIHPWIDANLTGMRTVMKDTFYGQHLAQQTVPSAIQAHLANPDPSKALVMSFHGWTGSGKNFLSRIIAEHIYKKGMNSRFVNTFVATTHFPHKEYLSTYQDQLRSWIVGNLTECPHALFIFDEVDKLPVKLLDTVKPFMDHYGNIHGVDPRKSIFIFLSNAGSEEIARQAWEYYDAGKPRESITLKEMEELLSLEAFNRGGLKLSELISSHMIDHFVPFFPLERRHVIECARDYLKTQSVRATSQQLEQIAESLTYFPKENPVFSASGCRNVDKKSDLIMFEDDDV